jgi:hypothetical protein
MVQDAKKLRPGIVAGVKGKYVLMSEECGADSVVPKRDRAADIFPMKYDMAIVPPGAGEARVWSQLVGYRDGRPAPAGKKKEPRKKAAAAR